MNPKLLLSLAVVLAVVSFNTIAIGDDQPAQIVILKLDDITAYGGGPINPRWQRVTDYLGDKGIKASYGIIGYSMEEENEAYFNWIKSLHASGKVEFWNHGYRRRSAADKTGEFEESYEIQKEALEKTQRLAKEKLGIDLVAFGPHWSGMNEHTPRALDSIPDIKICFYGPTGTKKLVLPRYLNLEVPTHVPNFTKFKADYDRIGRDKRCLTLQGHPCSWNDERWADFVRIIEFLIAKDCVFMTPSEYMKTIAGE